MIALWRKLDTSGTNFGCRHCYDLTYLSCQESHKYDRMYAQLADGIPGLTAKEVGRMFMEDY